MDTHAARRARRKAIVEDLRKATTDEEASPPEWADLYNETAGQGTVFKEEVTAETARFVDEPDIRKALARRERVAVSITERIEKVNAKIRRLNLITPDARFTRPVLDAEALLRPLFHTTRRPTDG